MNHSLYKKWLEVYLYGELTDPELAELKQHIEKCEECRKDFDAKTRLKNILSEKKLEEPDEKLLIEARQELRAALRIERNRIPFWKRVSEKLFRPMEMPFRYALGAAATLVIGIFIGYMVFKPGTEVEPITTQLNPGNSVFLESGTQISNVRVNPSSDNGTIEFTFDAVKPVHIKGNIDDERIQKVLLYSMLNERNPGARLNSLSIINSKAPKNFDVDIKDAVISVVKHDENPGVRREALELLNKLPFDNEVKGAYLYVLSNDINSAMRIEAINNLSRALKQGYTLDQGELMQFKDKFQDDENNYVRYRAQTVLKEFK